MFKKLIDKLFSIDKKPKEETICRKKSQTIEEMLKNMEETNKETKRIVDSFKWYNIFPNF